MTPSSLTNTHLDIPRTTSSIIASGSRAGVMAGEEHDDRLNYCLLLALYTLQGIPMVSASLCVMKVCEID
jgi:hypothetical protein